MSFIALEIYYIWSTHERKIALQYWSDCENNKDIIEVIYDKSIRNSNDIVVGCRTFGYMVDDAGVVVSELSSLLGKYFRIKNQKDQNKDKKGNSVAEKLVMNSEIWIHFDSVPSPTDTVSGYNNCTSYGENLSTIGDEKFEVMSASNKNEGKTVELQHKSSGKYCLITFDNSSVLTLISFLSDLAIAASLIHSSSGFDRWKAPTTSSIIC